MAEQTEQQRRLIQQARQRAAAETGRKRGSEGRSFGNILDSITQGLTLGFGDELTAHEAAIFGKTPEGAIFDYSDPYQTRYDRALTAERAQQNQFEQDNPATAFTAEVGGAMIPALMSGGTTAPTSVGAGLGRAMATGVGTGAIYGFGEGEGGVENRIDSAKVNALLGGLGGAASVPLAAAGRGMVNWLKSWFDKVPPSQRSAARKIVSDMRQQGLTTDDIVRELQSAEQAGQPFAVMDALGQAGQNRAQGVARSAGDGATDVQEFLLDRQANQRARTSDIVRDALGGQQTARATEDTLRSARDDAANVAYTAAREGSDPVDVRPVLKVINERIGQFGDVDVKGNATDRIFAKYRSQLTDRPLTAGDKVASPTPPPATDLSDFDRVLRMKKDVDDEIGAALRAGRKEQARDLYPLKNALDEALQASSEGYRQARQEFAADSSVIDAVSKGQAGAQLRNRAPDVVDEFQGLSPVAGPNTGISPQQAYREGMADRFLGDIEKLNESGNAVRNLTPDVSRNKLTAIANDPNDVLSRLDREKIMFETQRRGVQGSPTSEALSNIADVGGNTPTTKAGLIDRGISLVADQFTSAQRAALQRELADVLLARGAPAEQALRRAEQLVQSDENLQRLLQSGVIGASIISVDTSRLNEPISMTTIGRRD